MQHKNIFSVQDISVVVCLKNEEERIEECLKSIVTNKSGEIIVVDGDSSDKTAKLSSSYADKVIVFNYPNSSMVDDFMKLKAVEKHSKKVSVIDWDDMESPNYFTLSDKIDEVLTS